MVQGLGFSVVLPTLGGLGRPLSAAPIARNLLGLFSGFWG